jgi:hypothetical protein
VANTDIATIVNDKSALSNVALSEITDFESAMRVFADAGLVVNEMAEFGTGFTVLDDKSKLVGVPFIIAEWRFNIGKYINDDGEKGTFVSAAVVTKDGKKYVINDGGTGIAAQLRDVTERRRGQKHATPQNALYVHGGLTVSNYEWEDEKGHMQPGTTYYLSEAAKAND